MRNLVGILWLILAIAAAVMIAQPVGIAAQSFISLAIISLLAIIMFIRTQGVWRHIFLALASVCVLRYAFWRAFNTLPPTDDLYSFIPAILLFAAELYCILMLGMSLFVSSDPIRRPKAEMVEDELLPSVDVFIPTYNEDAKILTLTLAAAKKLDYPEDKLNVYLLDDGGTDEKCFSSDRTVAIAAKARRKELQELCARLGVNYHAREENSHAKAGNLNNGLSVSTGDLVAVFDADHIPSREFLSETVGHFVQNERLFLAQTPHFFSNPDPIEKNLGTFGKMPSENDMFYQRIQLGLDRWNASFFCGSAAVLRRDALERVGGFSGITITEDCETALSLHARGWESIYIDKPMISGLQPETLSSFIGQRSRWCQGMIQIMLLRNPLFQAGLTGAQRICYLTSNLFWMFPFARLAFLIAPLLFIVFDMKIYVSSSDEFVAYALTYLIVGEMIRTYLYGKVRWPWISEIYEYIQSIYLMRSIFAVLMSPRSPKFNVTDKSSANTERAYLSNLAPVYIILFLVFCAAQIYAIYRYQTEPEIGGLLLIVGAWNLLNLTVSGAALAVIIEKPWSKDPQTLPISRECEMHLGDRTLPVLLTSISGTSATIQPLNGEVIGAEERTSAKKKLWAQNEATSNLISSIDFNFKSGINRKGDDIELELNPSTEEFELISNLMMADMSIARQQRFALQKRKSFFVMTLRLIGWAITSPIKAISMWIFDRGNDKLDVEKSHADVTLKDKKGSTAQRQVEAV